MQKVCFSDREIFRTSPPELRPMGSNSLSYAHPKRWKLSRTLTMDRVLGASFTENLS
ncbi:hypothetical protein LEP1GSC035_2074 [Leptospira noguchii str. 2007001578]|uniref:Uncharacterized protein n=1 Tax=Leptospira noguchii str. 2007001578 TaxID=1049974 RepID=A0ABN0J7F6_9LEPT|nr:hypothetical protein LEP1GSC035_2074 [Leptospira noguchii str. 2007001578]